MKVTCPECRLIAKVHYVGRKQYKLSQPPEMETRCPVLSQQIAEGEPMDDPSCPYLNTEVIRSIERWER